MRRGSTAVLAAMLTLAAGVAPRAGFKLPASPAEKPDVLSCLVLLDGDLLTCAPCLDRTLGFLFEGSSGLPGTGVWIVVLYQRPKTGKDEALYRNMIGRRADSVLKAHRINRPAVIDAADNWKGFLDKDAGLIILDPRARSVRTFVLPLSPADRKTVLEMANSGGEHDSNVDHS